MTGGALYLVAAALLAVAVFRAFPSPNPQASAMVGVWRLAGWRAAMWVPVDFAVAWSAARQPAVEPEPALGSAG